MCKVIEYKLIEGFEDYMVSSDGKVWSLKKGKKKELKPKTDSCGYLLVRLYINGRQVHKYIHRLVAEAFISNPDNLPQVNHKDENKTNNCVDNLEWCTAEYNNNYGTHNEKVGKALGKAVVCLETGVVYPSTHEVSRKTGIKLPSISKCLNGRYKTAGGYQWARFKECTN